MKTLLLPLLLLFFTSLYSQDITTGLVAYYPFNGNANDASGNGNNGTVVNAVLAPDRFGNPNQAYAFDGSSSYITAPNTASLNTGAQITIAAYVKVEGFYPGTCHANAIVYKGNSDQVPGVAYLRFDDSQFAGAATCSVPGPADQTHENFYAQGTYSAPGYTPYIVTNQWYCVVYTYDGTNAKLYIDGILKASGIAPGYNFTNSNDLYIGHANNPPFPYWFNGVLDDVRIYNRALTLADVNVLCPLTPCTLSPPEIDFNYQQSPCNPHTIEFYNNSTSGTNPQWTFGDGGTSTLQNPTHTYANYGNYTVQLRLTNNGCTDTLVKTVSVNLTSADIILTHDTTLCAGSSKQLITKPALAFCWSPTQYLSDSVSANPIATPPVPITYYYTAQVTGTNVIVNGDFQNGNTGFTSDYAYANPNVTEGQYFVGTNAQAWNSSMNPCADHTSGSGLMLLVNGASVPDVKVWSEVVTITPNTNYAFSCWLQSLYPPNPSQLQFSINGKTLGSIFNADPTPCAWKQFFTTWNSGSNSSATISIINKNTQVQGNDFALDDISFAPVFIQRDSVTFTIAHPTVTARSDTSICPGDSVHLNATGAVSYSWTPITGLSNPNIANPWATSLVSTAYIVSGTNANGCVAKDTVDITDNPAPVITKSNDTLICRKDSAQLFASGGIQYAWSPAYSLDNPNIPNPIARPPVTTTYKVVVKNAGGCTSSDSVKITTRPIPSFSVSQNQTICTSSSKQLLASGGNVFNWQPATFLDNPTIANPVSTPDTSITYRVLITETTCNDTTTLYTRVTVLALPTVVATSSNDIDCITSSSQLSASGAIRYTWKPAGSLNNTTSGNPVATPVVTTTYYVSGLGSNGCTGKDSVVVVVSYNNKALYLMPTAFTPNGDGLNDCFGLKFWGSVSNLDFSIYNRWGQKIFHTTNPSACWDGKYKGDPQNQGAYVYVITATTACDTVFRKGVFELIR